MIEQVYQPQTYLQPSPENARTVQAVAPNARASIIVVNYNGGPLLRQCVASLLGDWCDDDEIIVVDNASTDESAAEVEQAFPEVRVVRSAVNLGFGEGNNIGVQWATGRYLAFLNPDTVVERGWLDTLITALEDNPAAGLATPKILLLDDPDHINTCGNDVHFTGLALCRGLGLHRTALAEAAEVGAISGAAFAIRRDLFESLGGFDGRFFLYMEDTDLSWRARMAGYRCLYAPGSVVYHQYTLRFGSQKTFYQERNRYVMLLKGLRWPTLLLLSPALLLSEMMTWSFVLLRDRPRLANKVRAYGWIWRNWKVIMNQRQRTQAMRRVRDRDLIGQCTHLLAYEQVGDSFLARLAHALLDPTFLALQRIALTLMWW
jgi:GT2 family glycosyltransferase